MFLSFTRIFRSCQARRLSLSTKPTVSRRPPRPCAVGVSTDPLSRLIVNTSKVSKPPNWQGAIRQLAKSQTTEQNSDKKHSHGSNGQLSFSPTSCSCRNLHKQDALSRNKTNVKRRLHFEQPRPVLKKAVNGYVLQTFSVFV